MPVEASCKPLAESGDAHQRRGQRVLLQGHDDLGFDLQYLFPDPEAGLVQLVRSSGRPEASPVTLVRCSDAAWPDVAATSADMRESWFLSHAASRWSPLLRIEAGVWYLVRRICVVFRVA